MSLMLRMCACPVELLMFHRVVKVQYHLVVAGVLLSVGCEMGLGRIAQVLLLDVTVFDSMTS